MSKLCIDLSYVSLSAWYYRFVLQTKFPQLMDIHHQWLKCKIRGGERYIQLWAPDSGRVLFHSIITIWGGGTLGAINWRWAMVFLCIPLYFYHCRYLTSFCITHLSVVILWTVLVCYVLAGWKHVCNFRLKSTITLRLHCHYSIKLPKVRSLCLYFLLIVTHV